MDKKKLVIIVGVILAAVFICVAVIGLTHPKDSSGYGDYKNPDSQTTGTTCETTVSTQDENSTTGTQNSDITFEIDGDGNLANPSQNTSGNNTSENGNTDSNTVSGNGDGNTGGNNASGNGNTGSGNAGTGDSGSSGGNSGSTESTESTESKENKMDFSFSDFFK